MKLKDILRATTVALAIVGGVLLTPQTAKAQTTTAITKVLSPEDKADLLKQTKIVQAAVNQWDFDAMMKHEHPAVFKLFDKDTFEQATRAAMAQFKKMDVKYIKTDFGEPTATYQSGKEVICFVPRTSLFQVQGKRIKSKAYWVAIRSNGDSEWKFIDGAGIENNRKSLWTMFPELPRDVQFPEWKQEALN